MVEETGQITQSFNPNNHLIQIKNRNGSADYLPVQFRLVWFRELCPEGSIETEMLHLDLDRETEEEGYTWNNETRRSEKIIKRANGLAVFKAIVKDGKGGIATGTKSEKAASFPDYIEKAETGAIGRALAALGYGTQFAPDLDEGNRLADAPVNRSVHATPDDKPQPRESGASSLQRMIDIATARAEKIGKTWVAIKAEALGRVVPDSEIVVSDFTKINGLITKLEKGQAA